MAQKGFAQIVSTPQTNIKEVKKNIKFYFRFMSMHLNDLFNLF